MLLPKCASSPHFQLLICSSSFTEISLSFSPFHIQNPITIFLFFSKKSRFSQNFLLHDSRASAKILQVCVEEKTLINPGCNHQKTSVRRRFDNFPWQKGGVSDGLKCARTVMTIRRVKRRSAGTRAWKRNDIHRSLMSQRKKAEARTCKQMQIAPRDSIRLPDNADSSDVDRYAVNNLPRPSIYNPYFFFFFFRCFHMLLFHFLLLHLAIWY